jgi:hypothetical protein
VNIDYLSLLLFGFYFDCNTKSCFCGRMAGAASKIPVFRIGSE